MGQFEDAFMKALNALADNLRGSAEYSEAYDRALAMLINEPGYMAGMPVHHFSWRTCNFAQTQVGYVGAAIIAGEGDVTGNVVTVIMDDNDRREFAEWAAARKAAKVAEMLADGGVPRG